MARSSEPENRGNFTLPVKVIPRASSNRIVGFKNHELVIKLLAPPEDGRANRELVSFLADALGISRKEVRLVRGETSRHKLLALPVSVRDAVLSLPGAG